MCCFEQPVLRRLLSLPASLLTGVLLSGTAWTEPAEFVIGAGIQADSGDGVALSILGDVAIAEDTWLSGSFAHSGVDLPREQRIDYLHANLALDHFVDPFGLRLGVAYWGDSDILDSTDVRCALYFNGKNGSLTIDGEYRDFDFTLPPRDSLPVANVGFDARGVGLAGRVDMGERASIRAAAMVYDYSRDFRLGDAARLSDVASSSRLSVLGSLVDWRAGAGLAIDAGLSSWQLDVSAWRGAVDANDNLGVTLSLLTPVTERSDIEISLGYDDSSNYGDIVFLSVFVYLYGALN